MKIINKKFEDNFIIFETQLSNDELKQSESSVLTKLSKQMKVNGYRPGKIPLEIVKKQLTKEELQYRVLESISPKIVEEIEKSKEYEETDKVITNECSIDVKSFDNNGAIVLYKFEEYPDIQVEDYTKLELPNEKFGVTDEFVKEQLEYFMKRSSKYTKIKDDEQIVKNDLVTFTFECNAENEKPHKLKNHQLEVAKNDRVVDFDKQVVGMKIGETKTYKVKYPENYFIKEYANKDGEITLTIENAFHIEIPPLTDEFVKKLKLPNINTAKEFEAQFKKDLVTEQYSKYKQANLNTIYDQLEKVIKINFWPELLINKQTQIAIYNYVRNLEARGLTLDKYLKAINKSRSDFEIEMRESIKKSFLIENALEKIAKQEKIELPEQRVEEYYFSVATMSHQSIDEIKAQYDDEKVRAILLNNLVIDRLIDLNVK